MRASAFDMELNSSWKNCERPPRWYGQAIRNGTKRSKGWQNSEWLSDLRASGFHPDQAYNREKLRIRARLADLVLGRSKVQGSRIRHKYHGNVSKYPLTTFSDDSSCKEKSSIIRLFNSYFFQNSENKNQNKPFSLRPGPCQSWAIFPTLPTQLLC